jgi:hypothetical protein
MARMWTRKPGLYKKEVRSVTYAGQRGQVAAGLVSEVFCHGHLLGNQQARESNITSRPKNLPHSRCEQTSDGVTMVEFFVTPDSYPREFTRVGARRAVGVRALDGTKISEGSFEHVHRFQGGLIARMDIQKVDASTR